MEQRHRQQPGQAAAPEPPPALPPSGQQAPEPPGQQQLHGRQPASTDPLGQARQGAVTRQGHRTQPQPKQWPLGHPDLTQAPERRAQQRHGPTAGPQTPDKAAPEGDQARTQ